ncbi:alpha-N-acetyl-neuraminyl-2,3-beta-galactosyl-1,3-N-acetyl-galactosaminide alpha-2,6-sialyltransferase-like [Asterias amurensis]|uniref:alpha-N-acetyl-neuraminyl-2,3-beta-galactosyl-1, 3-N-acetyl-galactosaminide alpha-2,6-sialyltransferase-like n=1 Tax=Asterias amurensis TaxID=7602 RepID=UPI003AB39376
MLSVARVKKLGGMFFIAFCFQYMILFYVFAQSTAPDQKHKLIPRHATTKDIRGPTYHVHKVDPMSVSMREAYESRRLLVESNRPRLVSRREIIEEYRNPSSTMTESPAGSKRYIPLGRQTSGEEFLSCGTCALVSNSGHITHSRRGDEIDEAECVFRLNSAPTIGYELDVGRKTTVRVISQEGLSELIANASTLLDNHPSLKNVFVHGSEHAFTLGSIPRVMDSLSSKYPRVGFYRPSKALDGEADAEFEKHTGKHRLSSGTELSTGLYALMIMKDVCGEINVYGMVPEDYCRLHPNSNIPYSYYKKPVLPECMMYEYHENVDQGGKRLMTERRIFRNWAKSSRISFHDPSWD